MPCGEGGRLEAVAMTESRLLEETRLLTAEVPSLKEASLETCSVWTLVNNSSNNLKRKE